MLCILIRYDTATASVIAAPRSRVGTYILYSTLHPEGMMIWGYSTPLPEIQHTCIEVESIVLPCSVLPCLIERCVDR